MHLDLAPGVGAFSESLPVPPGALSDRAEVPPKPLRLGALTIDPPLLLAPMAGVSDLAFRRLMSDFGAPLVTTEMISVEGLLRNQAKSWRLLDQDPEMNARQAVQLFGNRPERIAEAARAVEGAGAPLIDINAGCPVRKVARQGAGASLLKDPDLLARLLGEVRRSVAVPLTVKIRLGWDSRTIRVVEIARRLEAAGADAITLHARTAVQLYQGAADWNWIKEVRQAVSIPVIGNGDVTSLTGACRMLKETGCAGVMVGRGSIGNPWLMAAIAATWKTPARRREVPGWEDLLATARWHLNLFTERRVCPPGHTRKLLIWYSKSCPGSAQLRAELSLLQEPGEMFERFQRWVDQLERSGVRFAPVQGAGELPDADQRTGHEGHCC